MLEGLRTGAIDWASHWDPMIRDRNGKPVRPINSIIIHRDMARRRNALAREEEAKLDHVARNLQRTADAKAAAAGAGGVFAGRGRRSTPEITVAKPGDMITDVPKMRAMWDYERNGDLDPSTIAAQSNTAYDWICRAHEAGDPEGRWLGHLHRWTQSANNRAYKDADCPFCTKAKDKICVASSLRATHPQLADPAEWDYATNDLREDGLTPDTVSYGSQKEVSWLCRAEGDANHGPYDLAVRARARLGQGCKECQKEIGKAKRKATFQKRRRQRHVLADEARAELNDSSELPKLRLLTADDLDEESF